MTPSDTVGFLALFAGRVSAFTCNRLCHPSTSIPAAIRSIPYRALGGSCAPTTVFGLPRRFLATMATETQLETQEDVASVQLAQSNGAPHENGKRRKLHGRAFYESIGSPKLVLAPMVEQSEFVGFITS